MSSSNNGVATVSGNGNSCKVYANASGSASITVRTSDGNYSATCYVSVKLPSPGGLYCDHVTNHDLEVRWNPVAGAVRYNIYLNSKFWGYTDSTVYVAGNLSANTEYWVKVYAVDSSGNEGFQSDNISTRTNS